MEELEKKRTAYEKAKEKAAALRQKAREFDYAARTARRKEIYRLKCAVGGLADIAGLLEADKGLILGGLLFIASASDTQKEEWKRKGSEILLERKLERKRKEKKEAER